VKSTSKRRYDVTPPAHESLVGFGVAEHIWPFVLATKNRDRKDAEGPPPRQHTSIVVCPALVSRKELRSDVA
jgi:hypothetical protein